MTDYGIDLSNWNRVDDWGAVRADNISFASIKVSESTDFVDPEAGNHTEGARSVGIYPGGYHFARNADLDTQVDVFAGQLHDHGLLGADSFPPMLDMESDDLRGNANEFVAAFTGKLRAITGVAQLAVYANLDWWTNVLRPDDWADGTVFLWVADWNGDPGNPRWTHPRLALHQHTNEGSVPGIPEFVDRDATVGDYTVGGLLVSVNDGDGGDVPPPPSEP